MCTGNEIVETTVQSDGILGKLYRPADDKTYPGIIVLGGSGGGLGWSDEMAGRLARCGFAAMALAYFRYGSLPKTLVNIPLEYFEAALDWISKQEKITDKKLAVVSASRGGELALILASRLAKIRAVIAYVPGSVVWPATGGITSIGRAAWTYRGHPLPHMKMGLSPRMLIAYAKMGLCRLSRRPFRETPQFLTALGHASLVDQAVIPVEKIRGPMLLISGDNDQLWPSDFMCKMIVSRLRTCRHPFPCKHLSYEGAGHAIGFPDLPPEAYPTKAYHSLTGMVYHLGGTLKNNAQAARSAWSEVVAFLEEYVSC